MLYTAPIEEGMLAARPAFEAPVVAQAPAALNYIPLFTAVKNTALEECSEWHGVADSAGKYGVLIVLAAGSVTLGDGTIVSDRIDLTQAAGTARSIGILTNWGGLQEGMIPVLEAGETLVFAWDGNSTGAYSATTPGAIKNLKLVPRLRENVL